MRRGTGKDIRGFTVIEMIVTITVLGIIGGLGASIVVGGGRALTQVRDTTDGLADAEYALNRMELDLSALADRSQVTTMTAGTLTLNVSGSPLTYSRSGTDVLRGTKTLARDVTAFTLTYYKADGTPATLAADLQRVGIELTITRRGNASALRTEVFPRTFRDSSMPTGADGTDTGINGHGGRRWWWFGRLWRWTRHRVW